MSLLLYSSTSKYAVFFFKIMPDFSDNSMAFLKDWSRRSMNCFTVSSKYIRNAFELMLAPFKGRQLILKSLWSNFLSP